MKKVFLPHTLQSKVSVPYFWILFCFMRCGRLRMATHYLALLSLRNEVDVPSSNIWAGSVTTLGNRLLWFFFCQKTHSWNSAAMLCESPTAYGEQQRFLAVRWTLSWDPEMTLQPWAWLIMESDPLVSVEPSQVGEAIPINPCPRCRFTLPIRATFPGNDCCLKSLRLRVFCVAVDDQIT